DGTKEPIVLLACGSFSPITYLHLRLFEISRDYLHTTNKYEVLAGYISPVNDAYGKKYLASAVDRINMCELAVNNDTSNWISVDRWESQQPDHLPSARVLERFNRCLNKDGGVLVDTLTNTKKRPIRVMLLAGADLIDSMNVPNLWSVPDMHTILGQFGCVVVERDGSDLWQIILNHDILYKHQNNIHIVKQVVQNDVSSTKIRLLLRRGLSIKYLLPDPVIEYIETAGLYKAL
ncbi:hypothetical protein BDF19DRAFT_387959, partial [Syncephalis fuscata]